MTKYARERRSTAWRPPLNALVFTKSYDGRNVSFEGSPRPAWTPSSCKTSASRASFAATAPNLPIHGSTQMLTSRSARDRMGLGCKRVVVGRELSLEEIAAVRDECEDIEIEAFVHGALCVAYSGQCFSSEANHGRSANRGQFARRLSTP